MSSRIVWSQRLNKIAGQQVTGALARAPDGYRGSGAPIGVDARADRLNLLPTSGGWFRRRRFRRPSKPLCTMTVRGNDDLERNGKAGQT